MSQLINSHQEVQERIESMDQSQTASATNNNNQNAPRKAQRGRWANEDEESFDDNVQTRGRQDNNLGS